MPKITHLLFDCDNTLVMSEELAFEACADVLNGVLASKGKTDRYTMEGLITKFVGQNFRGMLNTLNKDEKSPLGLTDEEIEEYVVLEENKVIEKLQQFAVPCTNCNEVLEDLAKEKKYELAVVSSSAKRRVVESLKKVGQDKYFPDDVVFSAATSLEKPTSKPDPAVYLFACKTLGVKPEESIAVEDSKSGTKSAVSAGIPVIGYVGSYHGEAKQEEMRKALLETGAKVVMTDWKEFKSKVAEIENDAKL